MPATDSLFADTKPNGPDFSVERQLYSRGFKSVAGVDEAGRGPLAGPVVAAAVVLDRKTIPPGLDDSKKLTAIKREALFDFILKTAQVAWASLPAREIDATDIRKASLKAMTLAVKLLPQSCDRVLIDGRDVPAGLLDVGQAMIKGDARSLSIAAASVVAKVVRDRMLTRAHTYLPEFGFDQHKGYGSRRHREAIYANGPCPIHRRSFSPIRDMVSK